MDAVFIGDGWGTLFPTPLAVFSEIFSADFALPDLTVTGTAFVAEPIASEPKNVTGTMKINFARMT